MTFKEFFRLLSAVLVGQTIGVLIWASAFAYFVGFNWIGE